MSAITSRVDIARPRSDVFAYVTDPTHLAQEASAVVRPTSAAETCHNWAAAAVS